MTQERWKRLKEIVGEALEEDSPTARTALLNRACAEDISLLREAESYLKEADTAIGNSYDPLEECAAVTAAALREEGLSMTGRRIGAYVVVRELGHGGMATVYLGARADGYFEKQVAIKVLKPGGGHTCRASWTFSRRAQGSGFSGTSEHRNSLRCRYDRGRNALLCHGIRAGHAGYRLCP